MKSHGVGGSFAPLIVDRRVKSNVFPAMISPGSWSHVRKPILRWLKQVEYKIALKRSESTPMVPRDGSRMAFPKHLHASHFYNGYYVVWETEY